MTDHEEQPTEVYDDRSFKALIEAEAARRRALGFEEPKLNVEAALKKWGKMRAQAVNQDLATSCYLVVIEGHEQTGYRAVCPALDGCQAGGQTREEARIRLIEEIRQRLAALGREGKPVPVETGLVETIPLATCLPVEV